MYGSVAALVGCSLFSMACTRELPPPVAPPRQRVELEAVPEGPIPAGSGRVLLDAEQGKGPVRVVRVERTEMSMSTSRGYARGVSVSTHLVCSKTPCAVDLPAGSHELVFQAARDERDASAATFDVTAGRTQVVRHAVGFVDPHGGWKALGNTGVVVGLSVALPGALVFALSGIGDQGNDTLRTTGTVMVGVGVVALALGVTCLVLGRTDLQPGATTQWTLPHAGTDARPTPQGDEHVRREGRPTVMATATGVGMIW